MPGQRVLDIENRADGEADLLAVIQADPVRLLDKHPQYTVFAAKFYFQVRQFVTQSFDARLKQLYQLVTRHFQT